MIIWGAIWGGVLGFFLDQHAAVLSTLIGALLGALAGSTLRQAVRKEIATQFGRPGQATPTQPGPVAAPPGAHHFDRDETGDDLGRQPSDAQAPAMEPALHAATRSRTVEPAAQQQSPPDQWAAMRGKPVDDPAGVSRIVDLARGWLFGGNTIVRLGLLVLFVGLAFLAKYAAEHSLLPPELRLAGIGTAGIALFVFGARLRTRKTDRLAYALALQGGGVAVLYLTVFAAFRLYQFLPSGAAFGLLAMICAFSTAIALMHNALPMAFIGFAGAFAAPLLVSTGQGNHVALFGYYLLLGVAIAAVAWLRAWRALNLLGFFSTFGVATVWGVLQYKPEQFASTEPFLIAFFLVYFVASLLYATRHSLAPRQAVDATLIFGTPLVAFGLQAALVHEIEYATGFSSLVLGAFYLGMGFWALRRRGTDNRVGRWMAECFVALGLGFVTLAVPLALDPQWTSAVWAAEGAAIYWMGRRQERWLARAIGLGLQLFAALSYLSTLASAPTAHWPLANPAFVGAALLAGSALALAHWSRDPVQSGESPLQRSFAALEHGLSPVLFWIGFLWLQFALGQEIGRAGTDTQGVPVPVLEPALHGKLRMLAWLASAFAMHLLALPARQRPWSSAATPAWFAVPVMLWSALDDVVLGRHGFQDGGWLIWPLALALHASMLRRLDSGTPQRLWSWIHSGGVWLVVLLAGNALVWAVQQGGLHRTAWASVILLVAASAVLLTLSRGSWFDPEGAGRWRWPLDRFTDAYLWRAAAPLAVLVALASLAVAVHSNGNAQPLPYLPLLNPTDMAVALGLAACALWLVRIRGSSFMLPSWVHNPRLQWVLAVIAFVAINTVWLRIAHQFAAVPWNARQLFDSFLVQAGYSILWTLLALGLMVAAHRKQMRPIWMVGATLLGATVLKLFLIDLSNRGGSERIVVFIAVGVLMLVVGYFAPLPPRPVNPVRLDAKPREGST